MEEERTRPELVQMVVLLAEALDVAPSLQDEDRIMRQIFQHALSYQMLTAKTPPKRNTWLGG